MYNQSQIGRVTRLAVFGLLGFTAIITVVPHGAVAGDSDEPPARVVRGALAWRSSEQPDGDALVIGSLDRLVCTDEGVLAFDDQLRSVVAVSKDGFTTRRIQVEGEAPGHVTMVSDIDVDRSENRLVVQQGPMPAKTVLRAPLEPPFDQTMEVAFPPASGALRVGAAVRSAGDWIAVLVTEQSMADLDERRALLSVHNVAQRKFYDPMQRSAVNSIGEGSPAYWVWDIGRDGTLFLSADHDAATVGAFTLDGGELYQVDLAVSPVAKPREMVRDVQASYDSANRAGVPLPMEVQENYRTILDVVARDHALYVLTSRGLGRAENASRVVRWIVLDSSIGLAVGTIEVVLPPDGLRPLKATCDGEWAYVLVAREDYDDEPEILAFRLEELRADSD